MKKIIIFGVCLFFNFGCSKPISGFLTGSGHNPDDNVSSIAFSKVSPGANMCTGLEVTTRFAVTTFEKTAYGTAVKSKFSFHRTRQN